jgi:methionyl aminopeptidase
VPRSYEIIKPTEDWKFDIAEKVPSDILIPDYAKNCKLENVDFLQLPKPWNPEEIAKIRKSCKIAQKVLSKVDDLIEPGVTTQQINAKIHSWIVEEKGCILKLLIKQYSLIDPILFSLSINSRL